MFNFRRTESSYRGRDIRKKVPGKVEKTKGAKEEDQHVLHQEEDEEEEGRRGSKRSKRLRTSGLPPVKLSPMKACKECDG